MTETQPEKRLIGYARVSTYGQTLDTQLEQLCATGCSSRNIYREKVTGARADRRELLRMLDRRQHAETLRPLLQRQERRRQQQTDECAEHDAAPGFPPRAPSPTVASRQVPSPAMRE